MANKKTGKIYKTVLNSTSHVFNRKLLQELLEKSAACTINDEETEQLLKYMNKLGWDFKSFVLDMLPDGINSGGVQISWQEWQFTIIDNVMRTLIKGRGFMCVMAPPQTGKTLILAKLFSMYVMQAYPDKSIIYATYDDVRAGEVCDDLKNMIKSDFFQMHYGHKCNILSANDKITAWGDLKKKQKESSRMFTNTHGAGNFKAVGLQGTITGNPGDIMIVDDYFKGIVDADSRIKREKLYRTYTTCVQTRLQANSIMIIFATRWHHDDLIGRLMDIDRRRNVQRWKTFIYPAYLDNEYTIPLVKELDWKFKLAKEEMSYNDFMALYMQIPPMQGGAVFKRDWFKQYNHYINKSEYYRIVISVDTNYNKHSKSGDDCGITVWGETHNNKYYLIDYTANRLDINETIEQIQIYIKNYPTYDAVIIENKANGQPVIDQMRLTVPRILSYEPKGENKYQRASLTLSTFRSGCVFVPDNILLPTIETYLQQMVEFTGNNKEKDDLVDSTVMAIQYLAGLAPLHITSENPLAQIPMQDVYEGHYKPSYNNYNNYNNSKHIGRVRL